MADKRVGRMRTQVSGYVVKDLLKAALLLSPFIMPLGALPFLESAPFLAGVPSAFGQPKEQKDAETGSSISDVKVDEETLAKDSSTEINVKNADITAIIRIFSKKTRRNFILDERVKGKVSIYLPGRVSSEESMRILDSVLAYKGFASVPIGKNLWKIVPAKEAKSSTIPTQRDPPDGTPGPEVVTRLVQLKYINADEVRQLLAQLISADGFLSAYAATNSLVLIDSEDNIARLLDIVNTMDVPFSNREMTIIPIVNAEAKDIAEKLNEILGLNSSQGPGSGGAAAGGNLDFGLELARARVRQMAMQNAGGAQAGMNPNQTGAAPGGGEAASASVGARASQPKIIADERTNALVIVADEDTTARVRAIVSQLDSKVDMSGAQYWVYRCQHASADELADVLGGLVGKGGSGSRSGSEGGGMFNAGSDLISGSTGGSSRRSGRQSGQNRTPGQSRGTTSSGNGGASSVELSENLSITADKSTNTLVIFGNKTDYQKIKALLEKLDVKRRQVLVEAMLLEVGIDDNRDNRVSWIASAGGADGGILASNNGNSIAGMLENPAGIQDFAIAAASAGSLTLPGGVVIPSQTLLLNAVRANSNVNVLSAPTILTTDNEQAEIVVGSNVPFVTSSATSDQNLNNTFNNVERQDVGITLRLTPQISSGDSVTLKIFTEVSSVLSTDPNLGPTTAIRTSETSVITKDSQMIVIGGLMSDSLNESERGVPFLKDIPVLGHLFKSSNERRQRTNLLILITPRIIRDQFDARDRTISERDRVSREMQYREMVPDRGEVLFNRDIDRVSEATAYEGPIPSTIFEPQHADPNDAAAPPAPRDSASSVQHPTEFRSPADEVLEFKVDPKFAPSEEPKGRLNPSSTKSSSKAAPGVPGGQRFVVLKVLGSQEDLHKLPFAGSIIKMAGWKGGAQETVVGLSLPVDAGAKATDYFRVGTERHYELGTSEESPEGAPKSVAVIALGVFANESEASGFYPGLAKGSWYTLSPYEILSIGDGPWK